MKKPRARNLLSAFCLLASLFTIACVNSDIIGIIGEEVMLPCPCDSEMEPDQLYLYWQIKETVVDAFIKGSTPRSHQNIMYQNRTKLFVRENRTCSILLSQLSVKDENKYQCHYGRQNKQMLQVDVSLLVAANYTSPVLQAPGEQTGGRYTCTATGGFPAATIHWLLDEQPAPWNPETQQAVVNKSTGRYNVTSTLAANISQYSTLTCVVENKRLQVNLSQTLNSPHIQGDLQNHTVIPAAVLSCCVVIAVVCLGITMMRRYLGTSRKTVRHNDAVI
ncbi:ICOS ligand-like isoform X2 [Polyodon spathula]|uniref:ICOS ligand-like isoform X2 n=1 Tax=Polyodon spathula TaxID=7913 RepID=UPI001B7E8D50|nr:ICOS ligand-like isoform X2 [Polyodon spathula]